MKLLISNQHGAIVMALMPFLYGMLLAGPISLHFCLLLAWFSLYLMTYPFLNLFKGRNLELYRKWTLIYGIASLLFSLPALLYNWYILYFLAAMFPFVAINIYYVKQKDERALLNDFAGIIIFALAGMGAYYFPHYQWDEKIYWVALYPSLFFVGVTLYVKSVMRERKNPRYLQASIVFHLLCIIGCILFQHYLIAFAFVPPFIRSIVLPKHKLSVKQVGLIEMAVSLVFFAMLLWGSF